MAFFVRFANVSDLSGSESEGIGVNSRRQLNYNFYVSSDVSDKNDSDSEHLERKRRGKAGSRRYKRYLNSVLSDYESEFGESLL